MKHQSPLLWEHGHQLQLPTFYFVNQLIKVSQNSFTITRHPFQDVCALQTDKEPGEQSYLWTHHEGQKSPALIGAGLRHNSWATDKIWLNQQIWTRHRLSFWKFRTSRLWWVISFFRSEEHVETCICHVWPFSSIPKWSIFWADNKREKWVLWRA